VKIVSSPTNESNEALKHSMKMMEHKNLAIELSQQLGDGSQNYLQQLRIASATSKDGQNFKVESPVADEEIVVHEAEQRV
jgi:hypothetical protein